MGAATPFANLGRLNQLSRPSDSVSPGAKPSLTFGGQVHTV
jgi:hypothetical protein